MIETSDLKKVYKNGTVALDGISINIPDRVTAIIGRNGAGKTTFARIVSTQLMPTSGNARVNGLDILKDTKKIRNIMVSIPQEASPIGVLTPMEQVKLFLVGRGMSVNEANTVSSATLDELGLREFKNSPSDMLSGGMKRKVFVCMALAANPDVVFLDEPTTGLDPISRFEVWSAVKQLKGDVILTTHYMEEAENLSDRVILFEKGKVLEDGTVKTLLSRFKGKVRVELHHGDNYDVKVGSMKIKYVDSRDAEDYVIEGNTVKAITLDDVFLIHGVEVES
ncbi:MAG: ABC transporter ATP-binding protein [Candidatus Thermoplasmatota archaeon]|nr:ABC transporter ATP-binding protein [Candidatus Thermoplasmatota archaeon]MCL5665923.1 ABC transporter ATP-binding protein [Candidatus Thermoplasmatota archaeon]